MWTRTGMGVADIEQEEKKSSRANHCQGRKTHDDGVNFEKSDVQPWGREIRQGMWFRSSPPNRHFSSRFFIDIVLLWGSHCAFTFIIRIFILLRPETGGRLRNTDSVLGSKAEYSYQSREDALHRDRVDATGGRHMYMLHRYSIDQKARQHIDKMV
ncbi:uncharacterized protein BT62DRAFT_1072555 [Guyanagaster necrorhizus]|uniref:Uncharacterized protein n=1 Tax=Guyanagaster necrorhizus TaxID=856835 RepID=A0A9P7W0T5_9AGAR|nr:uncharacterized protein BT62DRAFT_1072555 [Guyanagaster necrorhizus MCA 3950]KAG7450489.1 hypothetical protein BT62DRAFT_1072555 [Guyanagaster necrorhizus MCA 3950]